MGPEDAETLLVTDTLLSCVWGDDVSEGRGGGEGGEGGREGGRVGGEGWSG